MANIYNEKPLVKVVMLKGQDGKDGEATLINQEDGSGVSLWIGTREEYEAIPTAELVENRIYYITDDTRDDFRTDLNDLDNKVDNNYTDLSADISELDNKVDDNYTELNTRLDELDSVVTEVTDFESDFKTWDNNKLIVKKVGDIINVRGAFTPKQNVTFRVNAGGFLKIGQLPNGLTPPQTITGVFYPYEDIGLRVQLRDNGSIYFYNGSDVAFSLTATYETPFYINEMFTI